MKRLISLMLVLCMTVALLPATYVFAEDKPITVLLDGKKLEFDVEPVLLNDRTMVPLRAIFEALGAKVYWNDYNESISGISKMGDKVVLSIGSYDAQINGEPVEIDAPPVLMNERTLVPLRFISEAFDCTVGWDDNTYTVTITDNSGKGSNVINRFYERAHFTTLGSWVEEGNTGIKGKTSPDNSNIFLEKTEGDAILKINIPVAGKYKVWGLSKDYANNNPGSRFFHIAVDGVRSATKFGAHGKDGYAWDEVGVYDFTEGEHTIAVQDTSNYYARCGGIFVSSDLSFTPPSAEADYVAYRAQETNLSGVIPSLYPQWAVGETQDLNTETIENEKIKIVFHKGTTYRSDVIQNEIYMKKGDEWVLVKDRNEELGVLAMCAEETVVSTKRPSVAALSDLPITAFSQVFDGFEGRINVASTRNFYETGKPEWLIPTSMTKVDDKTVVLNCTSDSVDATLTFCLDELTFEPKVTMDATVKNKGAYSFAFFNGDGVKDEEFDHVCAPLTYVKDFVPEEPFVLAEYMMFTPMCAFTFGEGENAISKGIAVDPTCVRQHVATPGLSDFGIMFRTPTGKARGQIVAPLFGSENSLFDEGENYSFSYRLLFNDADWYENYTHVAQDIFNCVDLRTNYYTSLNEAIYNTTDLMMDDIYGGWDDKDMAFYNMEAPYTTTQSNVIEIMQRYMLTDNEEILDERAVPSVAYMLSRGGKHMKRTEGTNSYATVAPTPLKGFDRGFGSPAYIGLYRMSQGRTPYLLNAGASVLASNSLTGVTGRSAMYDLTGDEQYLKDLIAAADKYIENGLNGTTFNSRPYGGFVLDDVDNMLNAYLYAYEATGEQKYLDAAKEMGKYTMALLWTTGYQNDYATTDYTVDPVKTAERPLANDEAYNWFSHKDGVQWRVGNPYGIMSKASETQNKLKEETAPGWVPARAGMTTEHLMTPSNGNAITMNMWAGSMLRLSKYTGDEFFLTQARNAMIGKFGNYGGYYWERYLLHDKQANYPYDGPDYDLIYWHHIPVFLGLLEDFLINDIWFRSDKNVEFPSVLGSGYAYFITNQYGFAPGKFYDENDMWLWLDRGIIEPDSVEVNYLAAKKKDTLGLALVNEGQNPLTTTITLGEKIPNSSSYSETATLYDEKGNKSTVEIKDGKFTVTIPGRGIQSVVLHPAVDVPSFAKASYTPSNDLGDTYKVFKGGKAHLLQFNDDSYYAYIYSTKLPTEVSSVTFEYTVGGKTESRTIDEYPFETIIKVEDASKDISFKVTAKNADGSTEVLGEETLRPISKTTITPYKYGDVKDEPVVSNLPDFKAFDLKAVTAGCGNSVLRIVAETNGAPFEKITQNFMTGAKIKAVFDAKAGGKFVLESVITGNEVRDNGTIVLTVNPTEKMPYDDYSKLAVFPATVKILPVDAKFEDYKIAGEDGASAEIPSKDDQNAPAMGDFEPVKLTYEVQGTANGNMRFVVPLSDFPFDVSENSLKGTKLTIVMTENATGKSEVYEQPVTANEMREGKTVIVCKYPDEVKPGDYDNGTVKTHKFALTLSKADATVDTKPSTDTPAKAGSFDEFKVKAVSLGLTQYFRIVLNTKDFPFEVAENNLKDLKVKVVITPKDGGNTEETEATVISNEMRDGGMTVIQIKQDDWVSRKIFDKHTAEVTFYSNK